MLVELCKKMIEIGTADDLSWEDRYSILFSEKYSELMYKVFKELNITFVYADPDSDYQDDVEAFVNALNDNMERFISICKYVKISSKLEEEIKQCL